MQRPCARFIPARAGNTTNIARCPVNGPVHPRTGGEHISLWLYCRNQNGSSPHGRGTRSRNWPRFWRETVHPRTGGEHDCSQRHSVLFDGSSPHGRGTLSGLLFSGLCFRFIPARAGNTLRPQFHTAIPTVHPRTGGEHLSAPTNSAKWIGSSPHGRGTLNEDGQVLASVRFIPARAGNTPGPPVGGRGRPVHPRTGGEHSAWCKISADGIGSSPHGRGTQITPMIKLICSRFIPARAGNTSAVLAPAVNLFGSSPHGRGTLLPGLVSQFKQRFIPARAGNTIAVLVVM